MGKDQKLSLGKKLKFKQSNDYNYMLEVFDSVDVDVSESLDFTTNFSKSISEIKAQNILRLKCKIGITYIELRPFINL
jgi:hypothetical protein